jgi:tetratricopeptide (TPR) repeat protein
MYHKALFNIDSAINIEPNRSDLWFLKGMILSETKTHLQLELALTSFIQAIIIRPKNDPAQLMVAQTLFNLGRYEEAIVRYKWIFKTYKKEAMNYMTLYPFAVSYLALNKADPLLGYFKNVLSKYDEYNKDMWFIRAVIYDKMGWKKEAIDVIEWLIEKSEDNKKRKYFEFLLAKYKGAIK